MAFFWEIEQGLCIMSLIFGEYPSCLRIEVKEVNISGELFILSLIYSYVAACRFYRPIEAETCSCKKLCDPPNNS
jgi:hypothetical protein